MFSSREHHRFWGFPDEQLGIDRVTQTIWIPSDEFLLTLHFFDASAAENEAWRPRGIWTEVKGQDLNIRSAETAFASSSFSYFDASEFKLIRNPLPKEAPEATLAVHYPIANYRYTICWNVLEEESLSPEERISLNNIRPRVIQFLRNSDKAKTFVTVCLQKVEEVLGKISVPYIEDEQIHACLYGIDTSTIRTGKYDFCGATLVCLTSEPGACSLAGVPLRWGRDIIGRAARQGLRVSLNRSQLRYAREVLHDLPQNIKIVIAEPLFCYRRDRFPSAVLAFATTRENSPLGNICEPKSARAQEVSEYVQALWLENFAQMLQL